MTVRNTGRPSEDIFDETWARMGKDAHVFVFTDAAEATGMNRGRGKVINIKAQPSDRIVTCAKLHPGEPVHYAEIKSTIEPGRFDFKLLRPKQGAYATFVLAAGGPYYVYIHSLHLNQWFKVPYQIIRFTKDLGRSSLTWAELIEKKLQWKHPHLSTT